MTATTYQEHFRETQFLPRLFSAFPLAVLCLIWMLTLADDFNWFDFSLSGFIFLGVTVVLVSARLVTEVREDSVYLNFAPFPFTSQLISFSKITSATARQYSAIGEYGGWGIRYNLFGNGRAYNVRGNQGVQLVFKDGRKLLIGSQRSEELAGLIQSKLTSG
jgi:hypothetical protein